MRNPDGYVRVEYDDGLIKEVETYQCNHCGAHKHLKSGDVPYGTCKLCFGFVCQWCYDRLPRTGCRPQEQMLAEMEGAINRRVGSTVPGWMLKTTASK